MRDLMKIEAKGVSNDRSKKKDAAHYYKSVVTQNIKTEKQIFCHILFKSTFL
jgi:hypothetical protein